MCLKLLMRNIRSCKGTKYMVRYLIKEYRPYLTRQEVKTINGQSKAGNEDAALKGLKKILKRKGIVIENRKFKN